MAQVFPVNPDPGTLDEAEQALARTLAGLPDEWTLLRRRQLGETPVDAMLVHPGIGVALIDLAPQRPDAAAETLRAGLEHERFAEFFPGELPIVAVSLDAAEIGMAGDRLAAAFEAVPLLGIGDPDWADAVIELLLLPDDLAMTPAGIFAAPPEPPPRPIPRPPPEPIPPPAAEPPPAPPPLLLEESVAPLRLRAEEPIAYAPPAARRRGWIAGLALAGLLAAGILVAWSLAGSDTGGDGTAGSGEAEIVLPPALPTLAPAPEAAGTKAEPPALPPAPPVMLAAKAMAPPPAAAPRPTAVPPLPAPEAIAAAAPAAPTAAEPAPPPAPAAAAWAAPPRPKPRQKRVAEAEKPAEPQRTAPEDTARLMRRELGADTAKDPAKTGPTAPPIDAADLPPLDQAAAAPAAAPAPAPPPAPQIGPPRRLGRPPVTAASEGASMPPDRRDCRPYTADTTLTGRGVAVEGMACRDGDGQWRLVSEVPQQ